MARLYWLLKSEPDVFSINDLRNRPKSREPWDGVRNYQARNFMRDEMQAGDLALFYHSRVSPMGVAGVCEIVREAYPDPSAWDPKSKYFDEKASPENPRWVMVDVQFVAEFPNYVTLEELKAEPKLDGMRVTQRGQRLSVQPVEKNHFDLVCQMGGWKG